MPIRTYPTPKQAQPLSIIKLACTGDDAKTPIREIRVKRPRKNIPEAPKGDMPYATDTGLQAELLAACERFGYPLEDKGRGKVTTRVPVWIYGNDISQTFRTARMWHNGTGMCCRCEEWELKSSEEAHRDGLVFTPGVDYSAQEEYWIGAATRQNWKPAPQGHGTRHVRDGAQYPHPCNPFKCPECQKGLCKLTGQILLKARGWASEQAVFIETTAWETNERFPASFYAIQAHAGNLMGACPFDLCLGFSRAKPNKAGVSTPRPFWYLSIPYGMTEEQVRAAGNDRATRLLEDYRSFAATGVEYAKLSAALNSPEGMKRFAEEMALGEADEPHALPEPRRALPPATDAVTESAVGRLVREYAMPETAARAMVAAADGDIDELFASLGPSPQDRGRETAGAVHIHETTVQDRIGTADGAEAEDAARDAADDAVEEAPMDDGGEPPAPQRVDDTPDDEAPPEGEAATETDTDAVTDDANETAPEGTEGDATAPAAPVPPLFDEMPASCMEVARRLAQTGAQEFVGALWTIVWEDMTGTPRRSTPNVANTGGADKELAMRRRAVEVCEQWWQAEGFEKYGKQSSMDL